MVVWHIVLYVGEDIRLGIEALAEIEQHQPDHRRFFGLEAHKRSASLMHLCHSLVDQHGDDRIDGVLAKAIVFGQFPDRGQLIALGILTAMDFFL